MKIPIITAIKNNFIILKSLMPIVHTSNDEHNRVIDIKLSIYLVDCVIKAKCKYKYFGKCFSKIINASIWQVDYQEDAKCVKNERFIEEDKLNKIQSQKIVKQYEQENGWR